MDASKAPHVDRRQFQWYNVAVILYMGIGSLAMGYSASIIGTTLAQTSFLLKFQLTTRSDATTLISLMNSLFQAGAFFGSILINVIGDHYGRKWTIAVANVLLVLSGALMAGSVNIAMFLIFRFVAGMGSWMLLGGIPLWMTEVAPPKNRGALVNIHGACLLLGYTWASWMGVAFYGLQTSGRHEEARKTLAKLHHPDEAEVEFSQIETQLSVDKQLPSSWGSLMTKRSYRKRALFSIGLAIGIQMTGVLVFNNYGSIIYEGLGIKGLNILLYQAGFNTLAFGCGIIGIFLIDLLPRNKLVALGTFLVTSCLVVEAALVHNFPVGPGQNDTALRAAVAMMFCYMAFSQLCLDEVQWVYYPEMFPNHLRGKGVCLGLATIALVNIMWLQVAPLAFKTIGWKFYLCFIIPAYLFAIIAFFFFPNTRGKPLEEIAAMFGDETEVYNGPLQIAERPDHHDPATGKDVEVSHEKIEHAG
ncbi:Sugar transporter STL1 [Cyphellophora attinorum]|uniref:Sugar transporter STL1 n=1 Tax=Cyphellophora attinorum TaxID=1664694 RepID=A0A0N1HBK6_9EURO|nr:Sugar transporter STL1 [Phialophora attinorum]KPI40804.1 Sugar transporter STL1 [Phialophora attinorum]